MKRFFRTRALVVLWLSFLALLALSAGCAANYGKKLEQNGCEVFYKKPVEKKTAKKLLDFLDGKGGFCDGNRKSVQLAKKGETFQFRMVIKAGKDKDESFVNGTAIVAAKLSVDVFDGVETEVHLCDNTFKTLRVVEAFKIPGARSTAPAKK